jgi:hypothetical protein
MKRGESQSRILIYVALLTLSVALLIIQIS